MCTHIDQKEPTQIQTSMCYALEYERDKHTQLVKDHNINVYTHTISLDDVEFFWQSSIMYKMCTHGFIERYNCNKQFDFYVISIVFL